jgi:hypothetical protein
MRRSPNLLRSVRAACCGLPLLQRTFGLDVLQCPKCGGRMKLVAAIRDPVEIARLCENLGEPTEPPPVQPPHALRARGPTRHQAQTSWEFADPP